MSNMSLRGVSAASCLVGAALGGCANPELDRMRSLDQPAAHELRADPSLIGREVSAQGKLSYVSEQEVTRRALVPEWRAKDGKHELTPTILSGPAVEYHYELRLLRPERDGMRTFNVNAFEKLPDGCYLLSGYLREGPNGRYLELSGSVNLPD